MNARAKGIKHENLAKKVLLAEGWKVYGVPPSRAWQKQEDIFGLWDLFCVKGKLFKLVQVKTNQKPSPKPFKEFWDEHGVDVLSCEVWIYYQRGKAKRWIGWRKIIIN